MADYPLKITLNKLTSMQHSMQQQAFHVSAHSICHHLESGFGDDWTQIFYVRRRCGCSFVFRILHYYIGFRTSKYLYAHGYDMEVGTLYNLFPQNLFGQTFPQKLVESLAKHYNCPVGIQANMLFSQVTRDILCKRDSFHLIGIAS